MPQLVNRDLLASAQELVPFIDRRPMYDEYHCRVLRRGDSLLVL